MTKIYAYKNDLGHLITNMVHTVPKVDVVILKRVGFIGCLE